MTIEKLKKMMPVEKIEKFPVYAAYYEVISEIHEIAPKIGRKNGEKIFDLLRKLEKEIDIVCAEQ